ncbi:MAG: heat-inducible transcriptional repressor HrcA [Rhodospirillales bacterium]|nr:heat-inducible transcriptional repressor HrcA [Rhodospirillales bacterium]QQS10512.1 MAG: heat-inducible transcriptional repressor HrcA [Rhodospirillales bacterium]
MNRSIPRFAPGATTLRESVAAPRPAAGGVASIAELNDRAREVFRRIVESYVETGEPVGSRALTRRLAEHLSPATIRNVMADLQDSGLLYAPHTSAGRVPTDAGLRLFVDGLLEVGNISQEERENIDGRCAAVGRSVQDALSEASSLLSGLSRCAGVVIAPRVDSTLKHIEFVNLGPGRALVVTVAENGTVENRVIDIPLGLPPSALIEASNYLSRRLVGRGFEEARRAIEEELGQQRAALDALTRRVVEAGLATWAGEPGSALIVRGQARLLEDVTALEDLDNIKRLFDALERGESFARLLDLSASAEGVKIFIGAENPLFGHAGCSVIVAPFRDARERIVGAIGVIGPTRINYARIVPLVDYTSKVVGRLIG